MKIMSYQYRNSHYKDKMIMNPHTWKDHLILRWVQGHLRIEKPLGNYLNSLWPSDVIWGQRPWSSLVQLMACHLFGTKPLPKPMMTSFYLFMTFRGY